MDITSVGLWLNGVCVAIGVALIFANISRYIEKKSQRDGDEATKALYGIAHGALWVGVGAAGGPSNLLNSLMFSASFIPYIFN